MLHGGAEVGRSRRDVAGPTGELGGAPRVEARTRQARMPGDIGQMGVGPIRTVQRTCYGRVQPHPADDSEVGISPGPEHIVGEGERPGSITGADDPDALDPLERVEDIVRATVECRRQQPTLDRVPDDDRGVDNIDVVAGRALEAFGDDLA